MNPRTKQKKFAYITPLDSRFKELFIDVIKDDLPFRDPNTEHNLYKWYITCKLHEFDIHTARERKLQHKPSLLTPWHDERLNSLITELYRIARTAPKEFVWYVFDVEVQNDKLVLVFWY